MKLTFLVLSIALLSSPALAQAPVYDWQLGNGLETTGPDTNTDTVGRPYEWVPALGHKGQVTGPVTPNAYGLGIGMDLTGKPVKAVTK